MTPEEHITDKRSFVVSLFEEAFGQTADEVLKNWDELTSLEMDGSKTNMLMAYRYAQEFKDELDFYGFMCFWLAIHNRWCKLPYYEEALKYCKQPDIKACIETNYNLAKSISEKESYDGLHPSAYGRIEGIEKIAGVYGRDDWTPLAKSQRRKTSLYIYREFGKISKHRCQQVKQDCVPY